MEVTLSDIKPLLESLCFYMRVSLILQGCLCGFFASFMVIYYIKIRGLL